MSLISNKSLFKIHGWLGLNLGLMLFVICLSGTFATLSNEFDWLVNEDLRIDQGDSEPDWQKMIDNLKREYPDAVNLGMYRGTYSGNGDYFSTVAYLYMPNDQTLKVYVNPRTGEIKGNTSFFNTQRFFRTFHRRFFDGNRGIFIITLLSIPMLIIVLAGFLFYKGWLKNLFTLRLNRKKRIQWSDGHKLAGIWSLLFALIIVLTGVFYFAELMIQAAEKTEVLLMEGPAQVQKEKLAGYPDLIPLLPMAAYINNAKKAHPHLSVEGVRLPQQAGDFVYVDGQAGNPLTRDRADHVLLDPATAEVVHVQRSQDLGVLPFITDIADPLHFGYFGGLTTKILWFIFGLIISFAILSGTYLWVIKIVEKTNSAANGFPWMRGVTVSVTLTMVYFIWVIFATVDGIRNYGALPDPISEHLSIQKIGELDSSLNVTYYFSEPDENYLELNIENDGLANIRQVSLAAEPSDSLKFSFDSYAGSYYLDLDESVRELLHNFDTIYLNIEANNGSNHLLELTSVDVLAAFDAVVQQKETYPQPVQREWPQSHPGIWIYIGLFVLVTVVIIGIWVRWLVHAIRKHVSPGDKKAASKVSQTPKPVLE